MKILRIVIVLISLLFMTGCRVTEAVDETPTPAFSSAGSNTSAEIKEEEAETAEEIIAVAENEKSEENGEIEEVFAENTPSVSEESKKQEEASQTGSNLADSVSSQTTPQEEPESEPVKPEQPDPEPEPAPAYVEPDPEPTPDSTPPKACPGGKDPDLGCEVILDTNYYRETFSSCAEAMERGQYYMDEVMYIGDIEITSYSVQEVYRNDHSIAYYGLNLWSNGSLIQ